ncbi:alanine/ornithine racemase family PLP-dependent enzyme [Romboutsia maritimum]|uniref:Alanine/ornithine racemase family PLP-dependent enzyme n=1 Tax=Romboutsia maritimum TaxID=2020948 RepID=A0A371IS64_9FIRM|nr:alanine/ornithine racemase family PLP-dependent enzyme [Romboutsia maritimum]RDY23330.1 alanine/ornithine racemase family PLP-dependent enzyme [Romboutsia maritimum]
MPQKIKYPLIEININKIYENTKTLVNICEKQGINITGVIKGVNAQPTIVEQMVKGGCKYISSSRIEQLIDLKNNGLNKANMLIRIPMLTEIEDLVQYVDISLNSEIEIINKIEEECKKQNKEHKVVIMMDLGDLREGFIDEKELIDVCLYIENKLKYVKLYGIGTNLSCYGSIKPTYDNLSKLCDVACKIEDKIHRELDIISGGATTTLPLVLEGRIPKKINNLRVGEAILVGQDLPYYWGHDLDNMYSDTVILKAEIIEIKNKPSQPIGEMYVDAFGNKPSFEDRGTRKRAILGVGKQDFVSHDSLIPLASGIEILGSSSDHLIIDIEDSDKEYKLGDIICFKLFYGNVLYLTACDYINKVFIYE